VLRAELIPALNEERRAELLREAENYRLAWLATSRRNGSQASLRAQLACILRNLANRLEVAQAESGVSTG
jgi:hypothetical protein